MKIYEKVYNIKSVIKDVIDSIDIDKISLFEQVKQISYKNIDKDLITYIEPVKIDKNILYIRVKNSIIFSEIIGFRQNQIKEKLLKKLESKNINEIKFIRQ